MKTTSTFAFLLLVTISSFAQTDQSASVRAAFNNYKTAILTDKGEEAVTYVNEKTIAYYSDMLQKVKTADSAQVQSLNLLDKLMVFSIRHRTSTEEIMTLDGKKLLVYAIKKGMVGKNSVQHNSIGDVTIEGKTAKGKFQMNGKDTPLVFGFTSEGGAWKVDLTSIFAISTMAFRKMIDDSGQPENEFLFSLLEMLTGTKPGPEIWIPTVKR